MPMTTTVQDVTFVAITPVHDKESPRSQRVLEEYANDNTKLQDSGEDFKGFTIKW